MNPIVIIGTGLSGYQLAREFRKVNQGTALMLITEDDGRFYSKPLLSTALTNKKNFDTLTTSDANTMASQLNATILSHTIVASIHPEEKFLIANQQKIFYDKLVLACGATVVKPAISGDAAEDVLSVNHLYHYRDFQAYIQNKKRIAILGAGLIGSEFANDLTNVGFEVDVIALGKFPLDLLVPESIGKILQDALEKNGVHFHFECTLQSINKKDTHYVLQLSNGKTIETDFVLSAIGLKPNITLAQTANVQTNRGILVNRFLETSIENIYALGDCAEVEGHVLPYITPLLNAGRALAKTLSGERTAVDYPAMPVTVKTPAHPIVVCPPPKNISGTWQVTVTDNNARALFMNEQNELYGFVLTNAACKERMELVKKIPPLF